MDVCQHFYSYKPLSLKVLHLPVGQTQTWLIGLKAPAALHSCFSFPLTFSAYQCSAACCLQPWEQTTWSWSLVHSDGWRHECGEMGRWMAFVVGMCHREADSGWWATRIFCSLCVSHISEDPDCLPCLCGRWICLYFLSYQSPAEMLAPSCPRYSWDKPRCNYGPQSFLNQDCHCTCEITVENSLYAERQQILRNTICMPSDSFPIYSVWLIISIDCWESETHHIPPNLSAHRRIVHIWVHLKISTWFPLRVLDTAGLCSSVERMSPLLLTSDWTDFILTLAIKTFSPDHFFSACCICFHTGGTCECSLSLMTCRCSKNSNLMIWHCRPAASDWWSNDLVH